MVLSIHNLSVGFQTRGGMSKVVDNVSFDLERGRPLGLVGESGCGKTTIGMTLMGLLPDNACLLGGEIFLGEDDLAKYSRRQWQGVRGRRIAMVFQAAMNALNPVQRVDDQVRESILAHHPDLSRAQLDHRVVQLFEMVKIPFSRSRDYPHEYSGGMKQRVVIAMALACDPEVIIADEPTTALDVIVQDQILTELRRIQKKMDTGLIFISHDMAVVASVCEDICVMYGGQIVEMGTKEEVFCSPCHPYTRVLLGSYLSLDTDRRLEIPIMGEAADFLSRPGVCRFMSSCNVCSGACDIEGPHWVSISPTHRVYCSQVEEGGRNG